MVIFFSLKECGLSEEPFQIQFLGLQLEFCFMGLFLEEQSITNFCQKGKEEFLKYSFQFTLRKGSKRNCKIFYYAPASPPLSEKILKMFHVP